MKTLLCTLIVVLAAMGCDGSATTEYATSTEAPSLAQADRLESVKLTNGTHTVTISKDQFRALLADRLARMEAAQAGIEITKQPIVVYNGAFGAGCSEPLNAASCPTTDSICGSDDTWVYNQHNGWNAAWPSQLVIGCYGGQGWSSWMYQHTYYDNSDTMRWWSAETRSTWAGSRAVEFHRPNQAALVVPAWWQVSFNPSIITSANYGTFNYLYHR